MSARAHVAVIGGGTAGMLAAAACLQQGFSVSVLEARAAPAAPLAPTFYALDPELVRTLKLARRGLAFAVRDLALVGLGGEGRALVLTRERQACARALMTASRADGEAWAASQTRLLTLARAARVLWWQDGPCPEALRARLAPYAAMSAAALLDSLYESEPLKAALAFDATVGGHSVLDAGSALALLWRLAQETSGLQGAVAVAAPGTLARALAAAADGAELRHGAQVTRILSHGGEATGIGLANGDVVPARHVLSTLSRRATLALADPAAAGFAALEAPAPRVAAGFVRLALHTLPASDIGRPLTQARLVLADRVEQLASAHAAACLGELPAEPPMEAVFAAAESGFALTLTIRPLPCAPKAGWRALKPVLAERALLALARHMPRLPGAIAGIEVLSPDDVAARRGHAQDVPAPLLGTYAERLATPLSGLYLCGDAAEPLPGVSGRAARLIARTLKERVP